MTTFTHSEAVAFFSALFGGEHHIPGPKRPIESEWRPAPDAFFNIYR